MKALILAAGFGTRLKPYTQFLPKALFPIAGVPVLKRMIDALRRAGCTEVAVNGHHLSQQVEFFLSGCDFRFPVLFRHESEILGTGGAIRNLCDFFDNEPFIVVNADIVTDISMADAYHRHLTSGATVSLVLHDHPAFNAVRVDPEDRVVGFERYAKSAGVPGTRNLAFTGIQILDPHIFSWIPERGFCDIISVYSEMIGKGVRITADIVSDHYWQDIGTPKRFRRAVMDVMAPDVFRSAFPDQPSNHQTRPFTYIHLSGDGSDRNWLRLVSGKRQLIVADHGLSLDKPGSELNAFVNIGKHFHQRKVPVPRIYAHDNFSGLAFVEDLGDVHLQDAVIKSKEIRSIEQLYRDCIDVLFTMTQSGLDGFDPDWTCQSRSYDEATILENECRYFVEAFANAYAKLGVCYNELAEEFSLLAKQTVASGVDGLIHRDFQSRNIMLRNGTPYLIDFQGARFGPVQYDLASLLIDPYTGIGPDVTQRLLSYAAERAASVFFCDPDRFIQGFRYCCITRNLQMLGAFGYLSLVKKKSFFQQFIPAACSMLAPHLRRTVPGSFPKLMAIAEKIETA